MHKIPRWWLPVAWLWVVAGLASAQTLNDPTLQVSEVVTGLNSPTSMAFIALHDILVVEKQDGLVRRVIDGVLQPNPVLDVAVDNASERGLLGITIHSQFPTQPYVYLYYTASSTDTDTSGSPPPVSNRIARFRWNGMALVDSTPILDLPATAGPNHNGGTIAFGPDGKLYAVIGDLNRRGQLQNIPTGPAPDDTSVIVRLNDDGTIPGDNPFFPQGGHLARYYAYGLRNSFGLGFDAVTAKLWMTENGPADYDEINLVEPGFNSGWVHLMGPEARTPGDLDSLFHVPGSQYRDPAFSWLNTVGPTALVFLHSVHLGAAYQDHLFVGDIKNGALYRFRPNAARDGFIVADPGLADLVADSGDELQELIFGTGFGGITDLKVGPDGRLYVLSFRQGSILAIGGPPVSVQGAIVDSTTGALLAGVQVRARRVDPLPTERVSGASDADGTYRLSDMAPGRYWIFFSRLGYWPHGRQVTLPGGTGITLDVPLRPRQPSP
jgi:glucose/arabinose dehydrogenase